MFGWVNSLPITAEPSGAVCPWSAVRSAVCAALCAALLSYAPCSFAQDAPSRLQDAPSRLVVLRAAADPAAAGSQGDAVDQSLLRALAEDAGFSDAYFSPTPFDDVQLLSGCDDSEGDCMRRVAIALGEDWVLVRELSASSAGTLELTLLAQDGASAGTARRAHAIVPRSDASAVDVHVRRMVRELYAARRLPAEERAHPDRRTPANAKQAVLRGVGWSSFLAGSALLSSGLVLGTLSSRAHDEHTRVEIRTAKDVDRSERLLDQSRKRAQAANTCFIAGSAFAAVGTGLLLWDLVRPSPQGERSLTFAAAPTRGGAALQLSGLIDGGY